MLRIPRSSIAGLVLSLPTLFAQTGGPRVLAISPTSGPEGTRVEIQGTNLQRVSLVRFGTEGSTFSAVSAEKIVALVPRWASTGPVEVITAGGRSTSPFPFVVMNDPRVPDDAGWKAGYVNPRPPKWEFHSVLLWGIAIADTRNRDYPSSQVEVAWTQLSCRVNGKEFVLNDDHGKVRGALYDRVPWFGNGKASDQMPFAYDAAGVVLKVGGHPDRIWHFWSFSPRQPIPPGKLDGCTAKANVRISSGALLQLGMDYWRETTGVWTGPDLNNHESGVSNWYFASPEWQEATFTDLGGPQF